MSASIWSGVYLSVVSPSFICSGSFFTWRSLQPWCHDLLLLRCVRINSGGGVLGWRHSSDVCKFILCVQDWAEVSRTSDVCTWTTLKFYERIVSLLEQTSLFKFQFFRSVRFPAVVNAAWVWHLVINDEIKWMQITERRTQRLPASQCVLSWCDGVPAGQTVMTFHKIKLNVVAWQNKENSHTQHAVKRHQKMTDTISKWHLTSAASCCHGNPPNIQHGWISVMSWMHEYKEQQQEEVL